MSKNLVKTKGNGVPKTLEWQEFKLRERVVCRLLNLCTVAVVFVMVVTGFIVWYSPDISSTAMGAVITAAAGGILKVGNFVVKQCKFKE